MRILALFFFLSVFTFASLAQDKSNYELSTGVDVCSRYIWRGLMFSDAPNIQPYMSVSWKGLTLMGWGSYATSKNYAEIDAFLSYKTHGLSINVNDYFSENEQDLRSSNYTQWHDTLTAHLIETSIDYVLPIEQFPLKLTASVFVYGADLNTQKKQNYSTYFEACYPIKKGDYDVSLFAGATTKRGYYASDAGFVNVGVKASRNIKITDTFSIPLGSSIIYHPQNKVIFFVVSLSL